MTAADTETMAPQRRIPGDEPTCRFPQRVVLWTLPFFALLVPLSLVGFYLFRDDVPVDDRDLIVEACVISPEENGWPLLKDAAGRCQWPEPFRSARDWEEEPNAYKRAEEMVDGIGWYPELAEKLLRKNEETLRLFDETSRLPKLQWRAGTRGSNRDFSSYHMRRLVNLVCVRAFAFERQGDVERAFENGMYVVRLGRKIGKNSDDWLRSGASAIESRGMQVLRALLRRQRTYACELKGYSEELLAGVVGPGDVTAMVRRDYAASLEFVREFEAAAAELDPDSMYAAMQAAATQLGAATQRSVSSIVARRVPAAWRHRVFFLPNATNLLLAKRARGEIRNAGRPVKEWEAVESMPHAWDGLGGWLRFLPIRNGIGKFAFGRTSRSGWKTGVPLRVEALLLGTWIAVECQRAQQGQLPASLEELVPRHLAAVPLDPYDGEPLRYSHETGVLYSVGEDFIDSGGSTRPDWRYTVWDASEPTLRVDG